MSYIDTLEQALDRKMVQSQANKIKQSASHETDYNVIQSQVDDFLQYVEAKSIIREIREAEKQGQITSIDTTPARKEIAELNKLIQGLGK